MPGITFRVGISSSGSAGKWLSLSLCMRAATICVWSGTTAAAAGVGAGVMSQRRLKSKRSWTSARTAGSSISDTRKILKSRSGWSFFVQPRHDLKPFVMRSVTHALQYSCFSQHGAVTMLPPLCPAVCLQTGQVVLSSVCCSIAFLFPVAFDASPVGVCELLATARAAASIGAIGTLGGAATTSVPGALLLAAVPSTDGDSDKASIEEVLTAQPYCRMPPRQGLLGVRDRGVATLPVARRGGAQRLCCVHQKPEGGLVSVPALPPRHKAPTLFRLCLRL